MQWQSIHRLKIFSNLRDVLHIKSVNILYITLLLEFILQKCFRLKLTIKTFYAKKYHLIYLVKTHNRFVSVQVSIIKKSYQISIIIRSKFSDYFSHDE